MKKFYFIISVVLFFAFTSNDILGQAFTIGNGAYSGYTYGPMRTPTTANYASRCAYIYAEDALGGIPHGASITSIEWNRVGTTGMVDTSTFKVYIGLTSLNDWGSASLDWDTVVTNTTLVFDGDPAPILGTSAGFKKFNFSTPFTYDTTLGKNIVILCDYHQQMGQSGITFTYDNATSFPPYVDYQVKYYYWTGSVGNLLTTSNQRHPQIILNVPITNNMKPTAIVSPAGVANGATADVKVAFENVGSNPSSGKYFVNIKDPADVIVYSDSNTYTGLAVGGIDTATFSPFSAFSTNGTYTVDAWVNADVDNFHGDDSLSGTFERFLPSKPMVVSWTSQYTNGISNRDSAFAALDALGVVYDAYDRYLVNITDFTAWRTVFWLEDGSLLDDERLAVNNFLGAGTAQYQNSLIILGDDIGYFHDIGRTNEDSLFFQGYLHADYFADDPQSADQTRICGAAVNVGLCDSLNSAYPDAVGAINGGLAAFRYADLAASSDTVCGVVYDGATYNTAYLPFEIRELVQSVTKAANQVVNGVMNWTINAGGSIPVELTSLTANVNGSNVTINWKTATETNNKGFAVERKIKSGTFEQIGFVAGYGTTTERRSYAFTDTKLDVGNYTYRLKQIDFDGTFKYTDEVSADVTAPKVYALEQNYPNPFNPATKIKYAVPVDGFVNLTIYNALGEKVTTLVQQIIKAGNYEVDFNASSFASGIYFYRMEAGNFVSVKKMMLIK